MQSLSETPPLPYVNMSKTGYVLSLLCFKGHNSWLGTLLNTWLIDLLVSEQAQLPDTLGGHSNVSHHVLIVSTALEFDKQTHLLVSVLLRNFTRV